MPVCNLAQTAKEYECVSVAKLDAIVPPTSWGPLQDFISADTRRRLPIMPKRFIYCE
jgi:hypothetical protein